jgi:hypothetical protein
MSLNGNKEFRFIPVRKHYTPARFLQEGWRCAPERAVIFPQSLSVRQQTESVYLSFISDSLKHPYHPG